jgi:membrane protein DedA with SNARE-associated domain
MTRKEFASFCREFWYLAPIILLIIVAVVYLMLQARDPMRLLSEYGYHIILLWTFLEGETIVIIAGWLSPHLGLRPWLIALCAFIGSFMSDQVMFSLGKYKGPAILRYFPRLEKNMDKAKCLFKKYDTALILSFRFIYGVRNITPIMLGISGVSHKKFFILNFIGAGVWAATFTYGGYFAGLAFQKAMTYFGKGILFILLAGIVGALALWYIRARCNVKKAKDIAARCEEEK